MVAATIDDLKDAIDDWRTAEDDASRIKALLVAFEWRDKFTDVWSSRDTKEYERGMRLITASGLRQAIVAGSPP